jgi:hypothetical protein
MGMFSPNICRGYLEEERDKGGKRGSMSFSIHLCMLSLHKCKHVTCISARYVIKKQFKEKLPRCNGSGL